MAKTTKMTPYWATTPCTYSDEEDEFLNEMEDNEESRAKELDLLILTYPDRDLMPLSKHKMKIIKGLKGDAK